MPVMDLSTAVLDFATGTYVVTRAAGPGTYVAGLFVPDAESTLNVTGMVAPLSGRELERLPEGLRTREVIQFFTVVALRVEAPEVRPDIVTIDGDDWQVQTIERWEPLGNFYRAILAKREDTA